MNSFASSCKVIMSTIRMNIAYLESQLTMTRIVSQLDEKGSFSIKSIEIEFQDCLEIGSCLEFHRVCDIVGFETLHVSNVRITEFLYIHI